MNIIGRAFLFRPRRVDELRDRSLWIQCQSAYGKHPCPEATGFQHSPVTSDSTYQAGAAAIPVTGRTQSPGFQHIFRSRLIRLQPDVGLVGAVGTAEEQVGSFRRVEPQCDPAFSDSSPTNGTNRSGTGFADEQGLPDGVRDCAGRSFDSRHHSGARRKRPVHSGEFSLEKNQSEVPVPQDTMQFTVLIS